MAKQLRRLQVTLVVEFLPGGVVERSGSASYVLEDADAPELTASGASTLNDVPMSSTLATVVRAALAEVEAATKVAPAKQRTVTDAQLGISR